MSRSDENAVTGKAVGGIRPFRSGIARTLGRRARPSLMRQPSLTGLETPDGGIATTPYQGHGQPNTNQQPPETAAADTYRAPDHTFRSQTQIAAIFARAIARGQRNL
jgi:hypothetical protein